MSQFLHPARFGLQPIGQAGGVPVEDKVGKEWAAEKENGPIARDGIFQLRGRNVIEIPGAVAKAEPDCLRGVFENANDFAGTEGADVMDVLRKLGVDVKGFDAMGGIGKAFEELFDHVALAVV